MANETQDLIFNLKANTSNAEQGMGKINRLTDDLKITTEKTSGALREFGGQLKQARDLSDVAGMATKALGQVLGASLGGTAVLVAGKALFDAFNSVQSAVKETEEKVKGAFKEIDKVGFPKTFEDGAMQADKLSAAADSVSKKIQEIESNPLQKFIAGITGAKDKMDELVISTQRAAQERIKLGATSAIAEEDFQRGLSEKDKALNELFRSYQVKADKIAASMLGAGAKPEDIKPVIDEIYNLHTRARDKMLADFSNKESLVAEENARKSSDLRRELSMSEFDLEQKSKDRLREQDRANAKEQLDANLKAIEEESKKREESAKKMEEYQLKLIDLTEKRAAIEQRIADSQLALLKKEGELSTAAAAAGGTARGEGQLPSSYEVGVSKQVKQAEAAGKRASIEKYREDIRQSLIEKQQKQGKPLKDIKIDAYAVQNEMARIAKEAKYQEALDQGYGSLQKYKDSVEKNKDSLDKVNQATNDLTKSMQEAQKIQGQPAPYEPGVTPEPTEAKKTGGEGGSLSDIYKLLKDNLIELKQYAHAA